MVRLNADGTQDALAPSQEYSFSVDGSASLDTVVRDLVLVDTTDAEDDVYVAGYAELAANRKGGFIAKLVRGNVLNNDFGPTDDGYAIASAANANLEYVKLIRRQGGGFFTLGLRNDEDAGDFEVRSLSGDGRASLTFGSNGYARVDFLLPGAIDTHINDDYDNEGRNRRFLPNIPVGRIGVGDDVARVIVWLMSGDAAYVTGECIGVNGGMF